VPHLRAITEAVLLEISTNPEIVSKANQKMETQLLGSNQKMVRIDTLGKQHYSDLGKRLNEN